MKDLFIRRFPEYLGKGIKVAAAQKGITITSLVCQIIQDWLETEERKEQEGKNYGKN